MPVWSECPLRSDAALGHPWSTCAVHLTKSIDTGHVAPCHTLLNPRATCIWHKPSTQIDPIWRLAGSTRDLTSTCCRCSALDEPLWLYVPLLLNCLGQSCWQLWGLSMVRLRARTVRAHRLHAHTDANATNDWAACTGKPDAGKHGPLPSCPSPC